MTKQKRTIMVGATEANQRFSRLLAEAEQGSEVVVTRRDRPVARLSALHSSSSLAVPFGRDPETGIPDYQARVDLIETCKKMNAVGLNQGTSGNASIRVDGGLLITPSGLDYDKLSPSDMVKIDYEGKVLRGGKAPSSEWHFHCRVMAAKPKAGALLHTHSVNATTLACLGREIPPFHYMIAVAGGRNIRCAPYATFGTEKLADAVLEALDCRLACLMANHGLIVLGRNIEDAFKRAVEIETLAEQYLKALAIGKPQLLTIGEMEVVLEKFKTYSAWADSRR